jgi:ABC-2 type transport system permease protein
VVERDVRVYWELALRGFRRTAIYRSAAISAVITNSFFGFIFCSVFIALYETRAEAGGYTLADALTFVFVTQAMIGLVEMWAWWRIAETVQTGQIATDLSRPIDFQLYWLAQDYGRAVCQFFVRSVPTFLVGVMAYGMLLPPDLLHWLALGPSLALAVTVSFAWRFCLNLTAFWWTDHRGIASLSGLATNLLSGFVIPLAMLPDWVRTLVYVLPPASIIAVPVDVFLGKLNNAELIAALLLQGFWAVATLGAGRLVLAAALRKLVVQGG